MKNQSHSREKHLIVFGKFMACRKALFGFGYSVLCTSHVRAQLLRSSRWLLWSVSLMQRWTDFPRFCSCSCDIAYCNFVIRISSSELSCGDQTRLGFCSTFTTSAVCLVNVKTRHGDILFIVDDWTTDNSYSSLKPTVLYYQVLLLPFACCPLPVAARPSERRSERNLLSPRSRA